MSTSSNDPDGENKLKGVDFTCRLIRSSAHNAQAQSVEKQLSANPGSGSDSAASFTSYALLGGITPLSSAPSWTGWVARTKGILKYCGIGRIAIELPYADRRGT